MKATIFARIGDFVRPYGYTHLEIKNDHSDLYRAEILVSGPAIEAVIMASVAELMGAPDLEAHLEARTLAAMNPYAVGLLAPV